LCQPQLNHRALFVHDRHDGNKEAARQYLAWETNLLSQIDPAERAHFRIWGAARGPRRIGRLSADGPCNLHEPLRCGRNSLLCCNTASFF
jgi:hypothetical protein